MEKSSTLGSIENVEPVMNTTKKGKISLKTPLLIVIAAILLVGIMVYVFFFSEIIKTPADTVVFGNIYTGVGGDTLSEALAVKDGKFIFVGDEKAVQKYIGKDTKVINRPDGMVMSGLSDTHTHVTMAYQTAKDQVDLSAASTVDEYVAIIKDFITKHPDIDIVTGMGWQYEAFENETPTKDILDFISTEHPIYIRSGDSHSAWVNSAMFARMGITKDTIDPVGGEIKRDADGNPAGMIKETVIGMYAKPLIPISSVEEYKEMIMNAQKEYASLGYTAYVEVFIDAPAANEALFKAYEELDKEGKLLLHTQAAWTISNNDKAKEEINHAIELRESAKGGMFELTDLKFFMDGVAESHGAFFSESYADEPGNYGLDRWPGEESFNLLVECISMGLKNDFIPHFHAIGDAAVTRALDAIESARKEVPEKSNVHAVITHLEIIKDSDFARFKDLNIIAAANLAWGSKVNEEHYEMEVKKIGAERAAKAYPYKTLADAGVTLSFATDYPPGSVALPFGGFSVGISRTILGLEELERESKDESLTRIEALDALTKNGAVQMRQESYRGTIEVGKSADFIIIDENLLTCLKGKAALTVVLNTFVEGEEIFHYE